MLPDFVVIGGMKCGTTALWHYLRMHPEIFVPRSRKNLNFFIEQDNWSRGVTWYESLFETSASAVKAIGEISTEYAKFPSFPGVPQRMASVVPAAKLIYLVRHPVDRLTSQYIHLVNAGREHRDINEALREIDGNPYIDYSRYWFQLEQYLPYYPKERIMLVDSEKLRTSPCETLSKVFGFLGVNSSFQPTEQIVIHTRDEKRRWNWLGRAIRRSPRHFNLYQYYLSRLPMPMKRAGLRIAGRAVVQPVIAPLVLQSLVKVFSSDGQKLQEYFGAGAPNWNLWELLRA